MLYYGSSLALNCFNFCWLFPYNVNKFGHALFERQTSTAKAKKRKVQRANAKLDGGTEGQYPL